MLSSVNKKHRNHIRQCFNRASATYDQYSYPQQRIGKQLIAHVMPCLRDKQAIIDIGCGTGIVTEQLALQCRSTIFYAIDIAEKLLILAEKRLAPYAIQIYQQDFETFMFKDIAFNLVFANMALHWSNALDFTLKNINHNLLERGTLAFSIPLSGTFPELVSVSKNNFHSLAMVQTLLKNSGFELMGFFEEHFTLTFDSTLNAMKSIKATGANYVFHKEKNSTGLGRHRLMHMLSQPTLTYHVGYFIASKQYHVV